MTYKLKRVLVPKKQGAQTLLALKRNCRILKETFMASEAWSFGFLRVLRFSSTLLKLLSLISLYSSNNIFNSEKCELLLSIHFYIAFQSSVSEILLRDLEIDFGKNRKIVLFEVKAQEY